MGEKNEKMAEKNESIWMGEKNEKKGMKKEKNLLPPQSTFN